MVVEWRIPSFSKQPQSLATVHGLHLIAPVAAVGSWPFSAFRCDLALLHNSKVFELTCTVTRCTLHTVHTAHNLLAYNIHFRYDLAIVGTDYQGRVKMKAWLEGLQLDDYWYTSNMMMDAYLMLDFQRRRNRKKTTGTAVDAAAAGGGSGGVADVDNANTDAELGESIAELLAFCDSNTSEVTGYHDADKSERRNAMAGAMHLYPVFFLCGHRPLYPDRVVAATLALQNPDGSFAYVLTDTVPVCWRVRACASACIAVCRVDACESQSLRRC